MMMIYYGTPGEIVPQMREKISHGEGFWLTVTGYSMTPTLRNLEDRVYIAPLVQEVKKGDILLTTAEGNRCILHRVIKRRGEMLYYQGDAQKVKEGPLPLRDVIGIVTKIERGGKETAVDRLFHFQSYIKNKGWKLRHIAARTARKLGLIH